MIIDAHVHVWDPTKAPYDWLGPHLAPIDRTVTLDEARPSLRRAGVDGCILVQAADHALDTAHMLAVADRCPEVVGVVGWAPLDEPGATERALTRWAEEPLIVGLRALVHEREDPEWVLGPAVTSSLGMVAAAGLPYEYVTSGPAALAVVPVLGERHPDLTIVVDHLGKPPVAAGSDSRAQWRRLLTEVAANPRSRAKVSGLYDGGSPQTWTVDDLREIVDVAVTAFGAERLMYGSDWPVSVLAGGYDRVWDALSAVFASLDDHARRCVLGDTAVRCYGLAATGRLLEDGEV
jgi:L-fuconolactonase